LLHGYGLQFGVELPLHFLHLNPECIDVCFNLDRFTVRQALFSIGLDLERLSFQQHLFVGQQLFIQRNFMHLIDDFLPFGFAFFLTGGYISASSLISAGLGAFWSGGGR